MKSAHYVIGPLWRVLISDMGLSEVDVLRRAALPVGFFDGATGRLPPDDFYRLWNAMEAEWGREDFAIHFNEYLPTDVFSPPVFAAMCSRDLVTAVRRLSTYKALLAPVEIRVEDQKETVAFTPIWHGSPAPPPESLVLSDLLFILRLGRAGTRRPMMAVEAWTETVTRVSPRYTATLGARLTRRAGHGITVRREDAEAHFLTSNEELWSSFEPELRRRLAAVGASASMGDRTEALLLEALPGGTFSLSEVARQLAVSERTLQRRLRSEGDSYKDVLDRTRRKLALNYLERSSLPPPEIAFLLGFAEVTSFYRAFSRWTGSTPESHRRLRDDAP